MLCPKVVADLCTVHDVDGFPCNQSRNRVGCDRATEGKGHLRLELPSERNRRVRFMIVLILGQSVVHWLACDRLPAHSIKF